MERIRFEVNGELALHAENEAARFALGEMIGSGISSAGFTAFRKTPCGSSPVLLTVFDPGLEPGSKVYLAEKARFIECCFERTRLQGFPGVPRVYEDRAGNTWVETGWTEQSRFLDELSADPDGFAQAFLNTLEAMRELHAAGFLLLTLKPDNVRIFSSAEGEVRAEILDFGGMIRAETLHDAGKRSGLLIGCSGIWSAPELKRGDFDSVSERSDIYSAGSILYRRLFGKLPDRPWDIAACIAGDMRRTDARADAPELTEKLAELAKSMLEYDPVLRPDAADVLKTLRAIQRCSASEKSR